MKTKNLWLAVAACLLLIAVYVVGYKVGYRPGYKTGYKAGENSAESKLREKEFAFQKQKEATRSRIYEEEKRTKEKHRREEKIEKIRAKILSDIEKSEDKEYEILMKLMEMRMQTTPDQPRAPDQFINYYLAANPQLLTSAYGTGVMVAGILYDDDNPSAVTVVGKIVREGDVVCGVRVVNIHKDKVEFEKNGKTWMQKVDETPKPYWE